MSSQTPFWSPIMNEIRSNVPNATLMNEIRSDVPDVTNIFCNSDGICEEENCLFCYQKSFASHPQIHCWSIKNTTSPRKLFKGSETTCIFDCDICHSEFKSKLYNVLTGYWCPYCKKKTEAKVYTFLK